MNSYEDQDEEAAAMAALMGFASFGTAPPAKKRKFNAATDAFVEGQSLEKIDKGGKKRHGSGGNEIRLGKARVFGKKEVVHAGRTNGDEIVLDGDDGDGAGEDGLNDIIRKTVQDEILKNPRLAEGNREEGPQYLDTSLHAPADFGWEGGYGPVYTDTSIAALAHSIPQAQNTISVSETAEVQARIDALLNSISANPALPPPKDDPDAVPEYLVSNPNISTNTDMSTLPSSSQHLPNRPAFTGGGGRGGRGARSRGGPGQSGGRGNDRRYEGYYDASFNHNPWDKEEKKRGLLAVGTWLEHPSHGQGRR